MDKAYFYYKARLTLNPTKDEWKDFAKLAKKNGKKINLSF